MIAYERWPSKPSRLRTTASASWTSSGRPPRSARATFATRRAIAEGDPVDASSRAGRSQRPGLADGAADLLGADPRLGQDRRQDLGLAGDAADQRLAAPRRAPRSTSIAVTPLRADAKVVDRGRGRRHGEVVQHQHAGAAQVLGDPALDPLERASRRGSAYGSVHRRARAQLVGTSCGKAGKRFAFHVPLFIGSAREIVRRRWTERPGVAPLPSWAAMAETDEPKGKGPTQGRVARTALLGRVAAGGAARWAGDRLDARGTDEAAPAPPRRPRRGDDRLARRPARGDARRGDEGRPGAVDDRVPRPRPRPVRVPAAAPRLAARRRPRGRLEADPRRARGRVGPTAGAGARRARPRAGRRGEHRPGPPRAHPRRRPRSRSRSSTRGSPRRSSPTCATCGCSPPSCAA